MKYISLITLFFCLLQSRGEELECSDLKDGVFELKSEVGTSIIKRKSNTQIEKADGLNHYSDVEWIDDCTYLLKNHKNYNKKLDQEDLNKVYKVEVLEILNDSIRIKTTANFTGFVVESKLKILELK